MGKHLRPRRQLSQAQRAALAQPLLDAVVDPAPDEGVDEKIDIAPLPAARHLGRLDAHLVEIAHVANDRLAACEAVEELIAAAKLHVGDTVRLRHDSKPDYLHGRAAEIIEKDGDKWVVHLDEPTTGRFAVADLRLPATQLEPARGGD